MCRGSWVVGRGSWVVGRVRFNIKDDLLYGKLVQDEKKLSG